MKVFKLGELFCGPGGIALGATNATIDNKDFKIVHEWANDYDEDTCETYRALILLNITLIPSFVAMLES